MACAIESTSQSWNKIETQNITLFRELTNSPYYRDFDINESYKFFTTKSASDQECYFGIKNNDEIVLPEMFSNFQLIELDSSNVILERDSWSGVYNLKERKWAIPLNYNRIEISPNGFIRAKKPGSVDLYGKKYKKLISGVNSVEKTYLENVYIVMMVTGNNKLYGLYDVVTEKYIVPCNYTRIKLKSRPNEFELVRNKRHRLLKIENKLIFSEWYILIDEMKYIGESGYLIKNDTIFQIRDSKVVDFSKDEHVKIEKLRSGFSIAVDKKKKYGVINNNGEPIVPFEYDDIYTSRNSSLLVVELNNKFGLYNNVDGKVIKLADCKYDQATLQRYNICALTNENESFAVIETIKGLKQIPYQEIQRVGVNGEWYIIGKANSTYKILDTNGELVRSDSYDSIEVLKNLKPKLGDSYKFLVYKDSNNKYGVLSSDGEIIVPPQFDEIVGISGLILVVKNNTKFGLYHLRDKQLLLPCLYDFIEENRNTDFFAGKNGRFYKIDLDEFNNKKIINSIRIL